MMKTTLFAISAFAAAALAQAPANSNAIGFTLIPTDNIPFGLQCNTQGTVSRPQVGCRVPSRGDPRRCWTECQKDAQCISYSHDSGSKTCETYRTFVLAQGFRASRSGKFFWNRNCLRDQCQATTVTVSLPARTVTTVSISTVTAPANTVTSVSTVTATASARSITQVSSASASTVFITVPAGTVTIPETNAQCATSIALVSSSNTANAGLTTLTSTSTPIPTITPVSSSTPSPDPTLSSTSASHCDARPTMLPNGGFETGALGQWVDRAYGGRPTVVSAANGYCLSGDYCLHVTAVTDSSGLGGFDSHVSHTVDTCVETTYDFRGFVRAGSLDALGCEVSIQVNVDNTSSGFRSSLSIALEEPDFYYMLRGDFIATGPNVPIYLTTSCTDRTKKVDVYWDGVVVSPQQQR